LADPPELRGRAARPDVVTTYSTTRDAPALQLVWRRTTPARWVGIARPVSIDIAGEGAAGGGCTPSGWSSCSTGLPEALPGRLATTIRNQLGATRKARGGACPKHGVESRGLIAGAGVREQHLTQPPPGLQRSQVVKKLEEPGDRIEPSPTPLICRLCSDRECGV